jgi:hypothetical protein
VTRRSRGIEEALSFCRTLPGPVGWHQIFGKKCYLRNRPWMRVLFSCEIRISFTYAKVKLFQQQY